MRPQSAEESPFTYPALADPQHDRIRRAAAVQGSAAMLHAARLIFGTTWIGRRTAKPVSCTSPGYCECRCPRGSASSTVRTDTLWTIGGHAYFLCSGMQDPQPAHQRPQRQQVIFCFLSHVRARLVRSISALGSCVEVKTSALPNTLTVSTEHRKPGKGTPGLGANIKTAG